MNPRGLYTLQGFITNVLHWSRGHTMSPRGLQSLIGFIAWVLHWFGRARDES